MTKPRKREEVSDKYKWDLSKIYKNEEELNKDIEVIKTKVEELLKYQ